MTQRVQKPVRPRGAAATAAAARWAAVQYGTGAPPAAEPVETVGNTAPATSPKGNTPSPSSRPDVVVIDSDSEGGVNTPSRVEIPSDSEGSTEGETPEAASPGDNSASLLGVEMAPLADPPVATPPYQFQRVVPNEYTPPSPRHAALTVSMRDIFSDPQLRHCALFSYNYDMPWLLSCFHGAIESIVTVSQRGCVLPASPADSPLSSRVHNIEVPMAPYTSHHTKMALCYYADGTARVFLPSNNYMPAEVQFPQQVCWSSPPLQRGGENPAPNAFRDGLLAYLASYSPAHRGREVETHVARRARTIDFAPLRDVPFVYSSPGSSAAAPAGIALLSREIRRGNIAAPSTLHILAQTSSLGARIGRTGDRALFPDYWVPAVLPLGADPTVCCPHILYPTLQQTMTDRRCLQAAGWFHSSEARSPEMHARLRAAGVFARSPAGTVPAHSKFYMQWHSGPEGEIPPSLDWCLYTSANLSKAAWGLPGGARPRNYEAGVLLRGPVECASFDERLAGGSRLGSSATAFTVSLPFPRRFEQYAPADRPTDAGLLDALRERLGG